MANDGFVRCQRVFDFRPIAAQRPVFQTLMRTEAVVVLQIFGNEKIEVLFAEDDEVIQHLKFDRFHSAFNEGVLIRSTDGRLHDFALIIHEYFLERFDENSFAIAHHVFDWKLGCFGLPKIRPHPQRFSRASRITSSRTFAFIPGLPIFFFGFPDFSIWSQRNQAPRLHFDGRRPS